MRASDPIVVVIVPERRDDHAVADTSARRERLQIDVARPRSGEVNDGRRGCGVRASIFDTSGNGTRGACGSESRKMDGEADADGDETNAWSAWSTRRTRYAPDVWSRRDTAAWAWP
jgi:hypothetical protein